MVSLQIRLLGPFEVLRDNQPLDAKEWRSRQNRTILKVLLCRRGAVVPADQLLEILWPDDNIESSRRRLHVRISQLRHTLAPNDPTAFIINASGGYIFRAQAECWIDTVVFENQAERGRRAQEENDLVEAISTYETARTLYRGDFLEENLYDDWSFVERERLRERNLTVLNELAECYAQQGRFRRAIGYCHQILAADPYREAVYVRLILYYYYAGERTLSIRTYERCRRILADELGTQPLPSTEAIINHIRDGSLWADPSAPRYPPPLYAGRLYDVPYSLSNPPFTGRQREYAWLIERCQNMESGIILVEGDVGVGKSRLIGEAIDYIKNQGTNVLSTQAPAGHSLPYSPVIDAFRAHSSSKLFHNLDKSSLAILAPLFPDINESTPDLPLLPELSAALEERRLWEAVSELIKESHPAGSVLFVDDAHHLDEATKRLLLKMSEHLIIVLAYRGRELAPGDSLLGHIHPLGYQRRVELLQLQPLNPEAIDSLLNQMAQDDLPGLARKLVQQTEGNPLFIIGTLQHLFEEGVIYTNAAGQWILAREVKLNLPPTTQHVIANRLGRLNRDQRHAFDLAAVVGGDFDFTLAKGASHLEPERLLDAIDALLDAGLLNELRLPRSPDFALTHGYYGEVAYDTLPLVRRRWFHGRIGRALLATTTDRDQDAPVLAYHFLQAGDEEQAFKWLVQAGDVALARYAHEDALKFYQQAIDLDAGESGPVWQRMGYTSHHLTRYSDGAHFQEMALATWKSLEDVPQQIRSHYALAECLREASDFTAAAEHAGIALRLAEQYGEQPELVAKGHIIISNALRSGQLAESETIRRHLLKALDIAQPAEAWLLIGEAYFWLGVLAIDRGDAHTALEYDRKALIHFQRTKQSGWEAIAYNNIAFHALMAGKPDRAVEIAQVGQDLARQIGSLNTLGWLLSTMGEIQTYLGQLSEAQDTLEKGLALVNEWGPLCLRPVFLADLAQVAMAQRAWETAVARLEAAKEIAEISAPQFIPRLHTYLAEAYLGQGDLTLAESEAQQAQKIAQEKAQQGMEGRAWRVLARVHASNGQADATIEAFRHSLKILEEMGDELEVARTWAAWGRWEQQLGNQAAFEKMNTARETFVNSGALLDLQRLGSTPLTSNLTPAL